MRDFGLNIPKNRIPWIKENFSNIEMVDIGKGFVLYKKTIHIPLDRNYENGMERFRIFMFCKVCISTGIFMLASVAT